METFKQFIQVQLERKNEYDISESRYKKWPVLYNDCCEFIKYKYRRSDIPILDIKLSFINEFYHHLRTVNKMIQNSAMKKAKDLKQVLDYAVMLDYISNNSFRFFKCKFMMTRRVKLTRQEIEHTSG